MSSVLPDTIGRFKILQSLGVGGMGAIYLARDPDLGSFVAIKVLTEAQSEDLRQRFLREAKAARSLRHTNIVTVYETGIADGMPFIVMEYIQGETLDALVKRGKKGGAIPIERKLQIMDEICAGLEYAHRKHIVHRDIKPANIMIDEEGVLRILDFGIARLGAGGGMTQAGQVMGTVNYMPPEQWRGAQVDQRADIFSTGALFYELLSYEKAFPGKEYAAIMMRIINEPPEPLGRFCPDVDSSVIAVVDKCLAKDPKDRYQDFGEVKSALIAARSNMASSTGPKTATGSAPVDRGQLLRMRAEQIERHLEAARRSLESGDFNRVRQSCQQVLILQPDHEEAIELDERATGAIEQQQLIRKYLSEANAELQRGGVTAASILVDRALSLHPESTDALQVRDAVDVERRRIAEVEARERLLDDALGEARHHLEAGAFDDATARIDHALSIDPDNQLARQLKVEVNAARVAKQREIDARAALQQATAETQARTAITKARELFGSGDRASGIQMLERFQPAALVAQALGELRIELREIDRREKEERQREEEWARRRREEAESDATRIERDATVGARDSAGETVLSGAAPADDRTVLSGTRPPTPGASDDRTVLHGASPDVLGGETVMHGSTQPHVVTNETVLHGSTSPYVVANETVMRGPAPEVFAGETVLHAPASPAIPVDKTVSRKPEPAPPLVRPAKVERVEREKPAQKVETREEKKAGTGEQKKPFPMAMVAGGVGLVAVVGLAIWFFSSSSAPPAPKPDTQPSPASVEVSSAASTGADRNAAAAGVTADATRRAAADAAAAANASSKKKAAADAAAADADARMKAAKADAAAANGDAKKKAAADAAIADAEAKKKAAAAAAAVEEEARVKAANDKAAAEKAAADKAAADKVAADRAAADKVAADKAAADRAAADKAAADKAAADRVAADKAAAAKTAADKAAAEKAAADKAAADKAAAEKAAADKTAADKAAAERLAAAAEGETPAINAVLGRYADAWSHRNAQAVKALNPGIGDPKALQDAFDKLQDSPYSVDKCSISQSGKTASAQCIWTWSSVDKAGKQVGKGQDSKTFTLEKLSDGSWRIKAIK